MKTATENPQWRTPYYSFDDVLTRCSYVTRRHKELPSLRILAIPVLQVKKMCV